MARSSKISSTDGGVGDAASPVDPSTEAVSGLPITTVAPRGAARRSDRLARDRTNAAAKALSAPRAGRDAKARALSLAPDGSSTTSARTRASQERTGGDRERELAELGKALRHLFKSLSKLRGRDTHLGASEVSQAQFELLIELFERGELHAGELAGAAQLSPATVTQMLDHLASSGHVERIRSSSDRRMVLCRLTAKGRRKVHTKRAVWQARWEGALEGVQSAELAAAIDVLERLCAVFDEDVEGTPCKALPQG